MESKTNVNEVANFVNKRNLDEICAFSKEHKLIFSKMPFVLEGISSQACRLLSKMASYQKTVDVTHLTKESVFISHAEQMLDTLKYRRHILHLKQLISDRERQNMRDKKDLEKFREELRVMKEDLERKPSMEAIEKEITTTKGRVLNYEKNITDAKKKEEKLEIKLEILPENVKALIQELDSLQHERDHLKMTSDNITLARSSKKDLLKLKSATKHI